MSISYQSRDIGTVRFRQVAASPGAGSMLLRFVLEWSIHAKKDQDYSIFGTFVLVSVAPEGESEYLHLGQALCSTGWTDQAREGRAYGTQVLYSLTLSMDQVVALEGLRKNRGLTFNLEVRGNAYGEYGLGSIDDALTARISQGDWVGLLSAARVADELLIGLRLPVFSDAASTASPVEFVKKAHSYLQNGQYDACIAECRRALESLWKTEGIGEASKAARSALADGKRRTQMSKFERTLAIGEAVRAFTNSAHHVGEDGGPEIFSRQDATLALAATASLVGAVVAPRPTAESDESSSS